jgi:hypothetical protein
MTEAISKERLYDLAKQLQDDVAVIKQTVTDQSKVLADVREHDSRLRTLQTETLLRCGRIEHRLDLTGAP